MRHQYNEPTKALPLVLAAGDELVDHHLCAVREIAELGFPEHERIRHRRRVAVFERQYAGFRQQRIVDVEAGFLGDVVQRYVTPPVFLVEQHRVPVRERAAPHVLSGQPDRMTLVEQRRVREFSA
jgi:hypothetical protein